MTDEDSRTPNVAPGEERDLTGRVALVTGAGRRIGRAIALALGRAGATIAAHYNASASGAAETVETLSSQGSIAAAFRRDLSDDTELAALVPEVVARFGRLDILVNSAGIMERTPLDAITVDQWDAVMNVNVRAPFFLARAAAGVMEHGVIVNIADLAAFETWPAYLAHGASKAALVHVTRGLARVLAPRVRVNAVAPGAVLLPDDWGEEAAARLVRTTPLGRLGSPDDVTQAVLYLVRAEYVTGEVIIVDGGRHVRG